MKITKKIKTTNIQKVPDKLITIPTLGEMSVLEQLIDIKDDDQENILDSMVLMDNKIMSTEKCERPGDMLDHPAEGENNCKKD